MNRSRYLSNIEINKKHTACYLFTKILKEKLKKSIPRFLQSRQDTNCPPSIFIPEKNPMIDYNIPPRGLHHDILAVVANLSTLVRMNLSFRFCFTLFDGANLFPPSNSLFSPSADCWVKKSHSAQLPGREDFFSSHRTQLSSKILSEMKDEKEARVGKVHGFVFALLPFSCHSILRPMFSCCHCL